MYILLWQLIIHDSTGPAVNVEVVFSSFYNIDSVRILGQVGYLMSCPIKMPHLVNSERFWAKYASDGP